MSTYATRFADPETQAPSTLETLVGLVELAELPAERVGRLRELLDELRAGDASSPRMRARLDALRVGEADTQVLDLARQAAIEAGYQRAGLGRRERAGVIDQDAYFALRHTAALRRSYGRVNPGQSLDLRYDVDWDDRLALGGFGAVYRALERGTERPVVIKFARPGVEGSVWVRERFRREIRALEAAAEAGLERVTRLVEHGEQDGTIYLVTDEVPGRSLGYLLEVYPHGLPQLVALRWGEQLFAALAALHDAGMVHRDVKPANLLFDALPDTDVIDAPASSGRGTGTLPGLVLADFGAALLFREERLQRYGDPGARTPYTPGYAPPEQVLHLGPEQGPHTDVYAAAVVLIEMLTGHALCDKATRLLDGSDAEPDDDALTALTNIPAPIAELLTRCVERDPDRRLGDARKVAATLRHEQRRLAEVPDAR